jgi:transcriptional regulator with XRE-family HTH domain
MVSEVTRRLDAGLATRILLLCVTVGGFTNRPVSDGSDKTKLEGRSSVPSEYAKSLGAKLRAIRQQQGLSLHGVEEKSKGRWKAVVVGSYERGDRAVTVQKLAELADFFGVPMRELLPGSASAAAAAAAPPRLILDLEALQHLDTSEAGPLMRYTATIQAQRGDYNGKVLSIRQDDLRTLAVIYDESPTTLTERFISWGVLNPEARGEVEDAEAAGA